MGGKTRGRRARGRNAPARRSAARGKAGQADRARQALRLPGLREVYDAVIAGCADLETAADALDAELWLAANVCAIQAEAPDDDAFHAAMLDLIGEAERDGRRQCLLLLRAMAAAGPQGLVDTAAGAAERLANRTAPDVDHRRELPGWVDTIGETTVDGDCHAWTDVYGEYTHVYCVYSYPGGRRHGLWHRGPPLPRLRGRGRATLERPAGRRVAAGPAAVRGGTAPPADPRPAREGLGTPRPGRSRTGP